MVQFHFEFRLNVSSCKFSHRIYLLKVTLQLLAAPLATLVYIYIYIFTRWAELYIYECYNVCLCTIIIIFLLSDDVISVSKLLHIILTQFFSSHNL